MREHNILTEAVVGFVNDGTGDVMTYHAWLEFNGRKVDLTLANVAPGVNRGPLLILDHEFQKHGTFEYSYHRQRGEAGDRVVERLLTSEFAEAIRHKEQEHQVMLEVCGSLERVTDYLNNAPDGFTYERFLRLLN